MVAVLSIEFNYWKHLLTIDPRFCFDCEFVQLWWLDRQLILLTVFINRSSCTVSSAYNEH